MPPDLPDEQFAEANAKADDASLMADIDALLTDGKTYVQAEIAFQKSRAGYAANRLKASAFYAAAALGLIHLALIALTVGAVIALTPLTGPWLATGIVVALLLLIAAIFLLRLRSRIGDIRAAFEDDGR